MTASDEPPLYNVRGAAKRCGVHPAAIYRALESGQLCPADAGHPIWIREADLLAWDHYRFLLRGAPRTQAQRIARIIQALGVAFPWDKSPEGYEYWRSVCERLALQLRDPARTSEESATIFLNAGVPRGSRAA